jgi:hypothetical protein
MQLGRILASLALKATNSDKRKGTPLSLAALSNPLREKSSGFVDDSETLLKRCKSANERVPDC